MTAWGVAGVERDRRNRQRERELKSRATVREVRRNIKNHTRERRLFWELLKVLSIKRARSHDRVFIKNHSCFCCMENRLEAGRRASKKARIETPWIEMTVTCTRGVAAKMEKRGWI